MAILNKKRGITFKMPDKDEIGMAFIKGAIPLMNKNKLIGIKGLLESYPDSKEKDEITICLKKEFEKRHLDYDKI